MLHQLMFSGRCGADLPSVSPKRRHRNHRKAQQGFVPARREEMGQLGLSLNEGQRLPQSCAQGIVTARAPHGGTGHTLASARRDGGQENAVPAPGGSQRPRQHGREGKRQRTQHGPVLRCL